MKNRTDKLLLTVTPLSLAVCLLLARGFFQGIHWVWPDWAGECYGYLTLTLPALPVFCLQLLLCRRSRRWVAALPGVVLLGGVLCFSWGFLTATGWDTLGWGILLVLSLPPAAGCALAWMVYGLRRRAQKRGRDLPPAGPVPSGK